jgi:predicted HD phosphohydrolase
MHLAQSSALAAADGDEYVAAALFCDPGALFNDFDGGIGNDFAVFHHAKAFFPNGV